MYLVSGLSGMPLSVSDLTEIDKDYVPGEWSDWVDLERSKFMVFIFILYLY